MAQISRRLLKSFTSLRARVNARFDALNADSWYPILVSGNYGTSGDSKRVIGDMNKKLC